MFSIGCKLSTIVVWSTMYSASGASESCKVLANVSVKVKHALSMRWSGAPPVSRVLAGLLAYLRSQN